MLQFLTWTFTGLGAGWLVRTLMRTRRDFGLEARNDYEVNLRAEMEIVAVHAKLDLLREQEWSGLRNVLDAQQRALAAIQARLDALDRPLPPG